MSTRLKLFLTIPLLAVIALLLIDSSTFMLAFNRGINIWALSVLPAILPFMVVCRLLATIATGKHNITVARLPRGGLGIALLSAISGYPMGAKLIQQSYNCGDMTTTNCIKTSIIASFASPIFIIATLGQNVLNSTKHAVLILVSHLLGGVINYALHYNSYNEKSPTTSNISKTTKGDIILDSLMSVLLVGVYIALFSVLCEVVLYVLPSYFSTTGILATSYILGLLEMTTGCINICSATNIATASVLCCSLVSFGGLCITMQCMTFYKQCKIKYGTVLKIKCMHCAISTILCYILVFLL